MKKIKLILITFLFITCASAQTLSDEVEIIEEEQLSESRYQIKQVKVYANTLDSQKTCLDDYLKRRKKLSVQLVLTPVTAIGSFYGGFGVGAMAGSLSYVILYQGLGLLTDPNGGWAQLGYIISGGALGVIAAESLTVAYTVYGVKDFIDNQHILKALMEAHHGEIGVDTTFLYNKLMKKHPQTQVTIYELSQYLMNQDQNGQLCDGSMKKKQPKILKNRLSKKLANSKDIFSKLIN